MIHSQITIIPHHYTTTYHNTICLHKQSKDVIMPAPCTQRNWLE